MRESPHRPDGDHIPFPRRPHYRFAFLTWQEFFPTPAHTCDLIFFLRPSPSLARGLVCPQATTFTRHRTRRGDTREIPNDHRDFDASGDVGRYRLELKTAWN